jgi:hypothetical protein
VADQTHLPARATSDVPRRDEHQEPSVDEPRREKSRRSPADVALWGLLVALSIIVWWFYFESRRPKHETGVTPALIPMLAEFVLFTFSLPKMAERSRSFTRAFGAFVLAMSLLVALFSTIYYTHGTTRNWSKPLSHIDAVYVTVGTLTTAGTSGVAAESRFAHGVLTSQMVLDLVVITGAFSILIGTYLARHDPHPKPRE